MYVFPQVLALGGEQEIMMIQVWRLDLIFLTMGFLGYMFKYIDQTNIVRTNSRCR